MFEDLPTTLGSGSQGFCLIAWFPVCFRTSSLSSEELLSSPHEPSGRASPLLLRHRIMVPSQGAISPPSQANQNISLKVILRHWVKAVLLVPDLDKMGWCSPRANDSHLFCHVKRTKPQNEAKKRQNSKMSSQCLSLGLWSSVNYCVFSSFFCEFTCGSLQVLKICEI